eukprot:2561932-Rhodomonas_salina.1
MRDPELVGEVASYTLPMQCFMDYRLAVCGLSPSIRVSCMQITNTSDRLGVPSCKQYLINWA